MAEMFAVYIYAGILCYTEACRSALKWKSLALLSLDTHENIRAVDER